MAEQTLLSVENLAPRDAPLPAWQGLSFSMAPGERLAIVGAPGSGKTLLLRTLSLVQPPGSGRILFEGQDITRVGGRALRALRRRLPYVGGDPMQSLPPRVSVGQALAEPLRIHRLGSSAEQSAQAEAVALRMGLNSLLLKRGVATLSAAMRQRLALGRALILQPRLLVCDELIERLEPAAARPLLETLSHACRAGHIAWLWSTSDPELAGAFADRAIVL